MTSPVVDKIRKLLRLAQDERGNATERETAMRQAHAMLAKHNIAMADVNSEEPAEARGKGSIAAHGRPWARRVAHAAAKLMFCEYLYASLGASTSDVRHIFIGKETNTLAASELAQYLIKSILKEGRRSANGQGEAWVRSFALGASNELWRRVELLIKETTTPAVNMSGCTALVLANVYAVESTANLALMKDLYPKLKTTGPRGKGSSSWEAAEAGKAFAKTMPLRKELK